VSQVGINKGIILRCTAYQISRFALQNKQNIYSITRRRDLILCNLYKKLCIKLVSIKELYYDARPTKSQDLLCKTIKTDIPLQEGGT